MCELQDEYAQLHTKPNGGSSTICVRLMLIVSVYEDSTYTYKGNQWGKDLLLGKH